MHHINALCKANLDLSKEVAEFLRNVPSANEESITDYLIWKWRELDKRFKFLKVKPFTRHAENAISGADFDLELWLLGPLRNFSMTIQAKKFVLPYDSYVKRLQYPNRTSGQLKKLLQYSQQTGRQPFYFIYSIPEATTELLCEGPRCQDAGVFVAHANQISNLISGVSANRLSRDAILAKSNPLHCLFCCPLARHGPDEFFRYYFPDASDSVSNDQPLPKYVMSLLESNSEGLILNREDIEHVKKFRAVAVYDLRKEA
jgi:hypothetical protein